MHTPNEHESHDKRASMKEGYEVTDVSVQGIMVFLVGLFVSVGVFFVLCFGLGKVINYGLAKQDGPTNRWNANSVASAGKLKNMESNPAAAQQELKQLTQTFPTPRLQTDDGNQDLANLHEREDLLLGHYSWVDESHTQGADPHRAGHGTDRAAWTAGRGKAGAAGTADGGRFGAGRAGSADGRVRTHGI